MSKRRPHHDQINAGPISAYEKGINLSPIPTPIRRRARESRPLHNIPLPNATNHSPSSLSSTMGGAIRTSPTEKSHVRPPRPPNAWILYRSHKLRELTQKAGEPRKVQAEVSKEISAMWNNETPEVRQYYDRLADEKKAEHQAAFPGYRFQPMKREEKERLKEERRQAKARERATKHGRGRHQTSSIPVAGPDGLRTSDITEMCNPIGPTPPLAAASSPEMLGSSSGQQQAQDNVNFQSMVASFLTPITPFIPGDPTPPSAVSPTTFMQQLQMDFAPQQPIIAPQPVVAQLPTSAPSQWDIPYEWQTIPTPDSIWPDAGQSAMGRITSGSVTQDYVSFDLPQSMQHNVTDWVDNSFEEVMQALLSATADPSVFQLSDLTSEDILKSPDHEIEVSIGQMPRPATTADLCDFAPAMDFHSLMSAPQVEESTVFPDHSTVQSFSAPQDQRRDFSASESYFHEFLNFESLLTQDDTIIPAYPTPSPQIDQVVSETKSTPYTPPAGAAFSSTRRVAGSWRPPLTDQPESPIEHSPPRQWGVPAG